MPGTPTPNHALPTMAGATDAGSTVDDTYNSAMTIIDGKLTKTFEVSVPVRVTGEVRVPVGQVDVIPQDIVAVKAGTTLKLTRVKYSIGAGTSVTFKIQRNGADATGFTGLAATTTPAETNPADIALSEGDRIQPIVTAVSGTPQNLSITLVYEVAV